LLNLVPLLRARDIVVDVCLPGGSRFSELLAVSGGVMRAHVVLVQKRLIPTWLVHVLLRTKVPVVYDFDDAVWVTPSGDPVPARERSRLELLVSGASAVVAGNLYLSGWAEQLQQEVTVIPTTLDTGVWSPKRRRAHQDLKLGWVGTRGNLTHLELIRPALARVLDAHPNVRLVVVSDTLPACFRNDDRIEFRRWELANEVSTLADVDVGLMPLTNNAWTRGKCAFKALQFMALAIPVIVSPVGMNSDVISHGHNGLFAVTEEDWITSLESLIGDGDLRQRLGEAGRSTVVENYDIVRAADALSSVLRKVAQGAH
jgi:glycosyltransferase involved in cell wall biosynthesis